MPPGDKDFFGVEALLAVEVLEMVGFILATGIGLVRVVFLVSDAFEIVDLFVTEDSVDKDVVELFGFVSFSFF